MPLTNEAVIPIGDKDLWNALTPYQDLAQQSRNSEIIFTILSWLFIWMMLSLVVQFLLLNHCEFKEIHWVHLVLVMGKMDCMD